jgi:hypothetical protein
MSKDNQKEESVSFEELRSQIILKSEGLLGDKEENDMSFIIPTDLVVDWKERPVKDESDSKYERARIVIRQTKIRKEEVTIRPFPYLRQKQIVREVPSKITVALYLDRSANGPYYTLFPQSKPPTLWYDNRLADQKGRKARINDLVHFNNFLEAAKKEAQ